MFLVKFFKIENNCILIYTKLSSSGKKAPFMFNKLIIESKTVCTCDVSECEGVSDRMAVIKIKQRP